MESIEVLNQRLKDYYGSDPISGRANYRIVWADDQLERRLMPVSDTGAELIYPEVRLVKKYYYLHNLYVLEHLTEVPYVDQVEIPESKQSYEPVWAYRDAHDNPLPPVWAGTVFIIDTIRAAMGHSDHAKYKEDTSPEAQEARVLELEKELFGNETEVTDALRYKEGIVVPNSYRKD